MDLEPGDASAVAFVTQIHAARPDWPLWLYYPPRPAVIGRIAEVACLRGAWSTPQVTRLEHEAEVRVNVRHLLDSVSRVQVFRLLHGILRQIPAGVREMVGVNLDRRGDVEPQGTRTLVRTAGTRGQLRHLERLCLDAKLPGPKRLLDHLALLLIAFKTMVCDVPSLRAAQQAGLSPKAFGELRRRLLGPDASLATLEPRAQFEFALMALAKACHVPPQIAERIVKEAVQQCVA